MLHPDGRLSSALVDNKDGAEDKILRKLVASAWFGSTPSSSRVITGTPFALARAEPVSSVQPRHKRIVLGPCRDHSMLASYVFATAPFERIHPRASFVHDVLIRYGHASGAHSDVRGLFDGATKLRLKSKEPKRAQWIRPVWGSSGVRLGIDSYTHSSEDLPFEVHPHTEQGCGGTTSVAMESFTDADAFERLLVHINSWGC